MARRRVALLVGLILALLVALAPLRRRSGLVLVAPACTTVIELDGVLRCDDDAPRTLADVCGGPATDPVEELHSGDLIDSQALCGGEAMSGEAMRGEPGRTRMDPSDLAALAVPVDVNLASRAELASLPGIGPVLAGRLADGRPYGDLEALLDVRGIGPGKLAKIGPRIRFASPSPTTRASARDPGQSPRAEPAARARRSAPAPPPTP